MSTSAREGLFHVIVRVGAGIALTTLTMLLVPRFIEPSEMGQVALALSIYAFFAILAEAGFRLYAIRTISEHNTGLPGELLINQSAHVAAVLLLTAGGYLVSRVFFPGIWAVSFLMVASMFLLQPLYFRRQLATAALEKDLNFKVVGRMEIVENAAYNLTLLGAAWLSLDAWSFVAAHMARCLVSYFQSLTLPFSCSYTRGRHWFSPEIRDAYKYGFSLQGIQWVHNLRGMLFNSMIVSFAGAPALGLYDRANMLGNSALGVVQGISDRFLFAYISKNFAKDPERCRLALSRAIRLIAWADKLIYLAVLFIALPLLVRFWGDRWSDISPLVPIVVLGSAIFGALVFPTYPLLNSTGHLRFMFYMALIPFFATLLLGPPLVLLWGAAGACWLGVIMWAGGFIWTRKAERVLGPLNWIRAWLFSGIFALSAYFILKSLIGHK